jgi:hypothetical protein
MERMNLTARLQSLKESPKSKSIGQRAEIVGWFLEKINKDREGTGYPPLTAKALAIKLSEKRTGLTTSNLFAFFRECEYSTHFSKKFWSSFKK